MGNKCQKSTILDKKSKITKNCQKIINFSKIWLLSPRIWLVAQTRPPLPKIWPLLKKNFFSYKKWDFLAIFSKKSHFDPPNPSKSATTRSSIKKCHKEKAFFHRFKAACKKLEKFIGWFRRTFQIFFFGHIWVEPRTRRGPYPCLTW